MPESDKEPKDDLGEECSIYSKAIKSNVNFKCTQVDQELAPLVIDEMKQLPDMH